MTTSELKIGALARRTGTNAPTIRYYEQIGLLPKASRQSGSQRVYDDSDAERLAFIRRCRDFGFSIEQVRLLTSLFQDRERPCNEARDLAQGHLQEIRDKLTELRKLERSLEGFVQSCDRSCAGGAGPDCIILEELGSESHARGCGAPQSSGARRQGLNIQLPMWSKK